MLIIKAKNNLPREEMKNIYRNLLEQMQLGLIFVDDSYEISVVEPSQEWISVSERLPEEETDVLVCNADGEIEISRGSYSTEMKNEFIWYTSGWRFGKVTAWMPLPEPYNEKEIK